jgi:hypothetical protein
MHYLDEELDASERLKEDTFLPMGSLEVTDQEVISRENLLSMFAAE